MESDESRENDDMPVYGPTSSTKLLLESGVRLF